MDNRGATQLTDDEVLGTRGLRIALIVEQLLVGELVQVALAESNAAPVRVFETAHLDLLQQLREFQPEVALAFLDRFGPLDWRFVESVTRAVPDARVLVVVHHERAGLLADVLAHGARGYLTYEASLTEMLTACREVRRGSVVAPVRTGREPAPPGRPLALEPEPNLTAREHEILGRLVEGQSTRQIAGELGISPHTARTHVQRVLHKLGVHSKLEAAAYAVRHHIV